MEWTHCQLCPRRCGADRTKAPGVCGGTAQVRIARAALHYWEEPCISGEEGSGTVFFSGCPLKCCYCQNYQISAENFGEEVSVPRLAEIFLELQLQGANNINLVTGSHFVPQIREALELDRGKLHIPIVYNSSAYETAETLRMLEGYVDIYLPDFKYCDSKWATRYSAAEDYFQVASGAILEMLRQVGKAQFDSQGRMTRGMIVRHLVLPGGAEDSIAVLRWLRDTLPLDDILISVMSQYTPFYKAAQYPELNRRLSQAEYDQVMDALDDLGIENGFVQELSSAKEEYTPDFSLQGVKKPALEDL